MLSFEPTQKLKHCGRGVGTGWAVWAYITVGMNGHSGLCVVSTDHPRQMEDVCTYDC